MKYILLAVLFINTSIYAQEFKPASKLFWDFHDGHPFLFVHEVTSAEAHCGRIKGNKNYSLYLTGEKWTYPLKDFTPKIPEGTKLYCWAELRFRDRHNHSLDKGFMTSLQPWTDYLAITYGINSKSFPLPPVIFVTQ